MNKENKPHPFDEVGGDSEKKSESYGEIKLSSPLFKKLDNFFYHYKWHTIIALVLVFAIIVCSFQMCSKTEYDMYFLYAGSEDVSMSAAEGDVSEYNKLLSALKQYTPDYNGDGERYVNINALYLPSEEKISEIAAEGDTHLLSKISENSKMFSQYITYGSYQICFLSEHLALEYTKDEADSPIAPITPYIDTDGGAELLSVYGVYLRSLPIYEKAGFNLLPDDTVICIRRLGLSDGSRQREQYQRSEEILRALLSLA